MFSTSNIISDPQKEKYDNMNKYKHIIQSHLKNDISNEMNFQSVNELLESEKQKNKTESWNKMDKTGKIQKLHAFSEKYGKEHSLPQKDIKALKVFFKECMEKNKLMKTKDVIYDKEKKEITSIPVLMLNATTRNFTLRNMDTKRISTLKSLTPKRASVKNTSQSSVADEEPVIINDKESDADVDTDTL